MNNLLNYDNLVYAISDTIGSFRAMITFYILDVVGSKFQVEDDLKAKNTWTVIKEILWRRNVIEF